MRRVEDWQKRLAMHLQWAKTQHFIWGLHDCVMYAARWVEIATGVDFYTAYGPYDSEEKAAAIIEAHGGLGAMVDAALGPGHRNHLKAKRGDLALMKIPHPTLGIVADDGATVSLLTQEGETRYPLTAAWRLWSV